MTALRSTVGSAARSQCLHALAAVANTPQGRAVVCQATETHPLSSYCEYRETAATDMSHAAMWVYSPFQLRSRHFALSFPSL
eukprot:3181327-Rhodomonas_salina.2